MTIPPIRTAGFLVRYRLYRAEFGVLRSLLYSL
jgi:hypothetical protein